MRSLAIRLVLMAALAAPMLALSGSAQELPNHFTGATLRLDLYHSGDAAEEHFSLDRLRLEGPWSGRRGRLLDETNLGKYLFSVRDPRTHRTLYSHGFSSIFGEWETTGPARAGSWRTVHESQRFPEPRHPVQLRIEKRRADGTFGEIWSLLVDPDDRSVDRSPINRRGTVWAVEEHGPASRKVDLLVLGDGYAAEEIDRYHEDVRRVVGALFAFEPFASRRTEFNVWAIDVASERSGVTRPRAGVWNDTPLGLQYNAFDSERYMLTFRNRELREVAAQAPYDFLILIANSDKYGGGGIFNLYSTAAAGSAQLPYLIVHEFGHAFAGLGDEYYTSEVAYEEFTRPGTEPWEPNLTALLDGRSKWQALVTPGTPVPTPWNQQEYDRIALAFQEQRRQLRAAGASEQRMDEYFAEVKRVTSALLQSEPYAGAIGAFEGAGYQARGLFRPAADCIMFTRNPDRFCAVCSAAIERVIDLYTR